MPFISKMVKTKSQSDKQCYTPFEFKDQINQFKNFLDLINISPKFNDN